MKTIFKVLSFILLIFNFGCLSNDTEKYIEDLKSENVTVRNNAIYYLGENREKRAVLMLIEFLKDDHPKETKLSAIEALGEIGDTRSVDVLLGVLRQKVYPLFEPSQKHKVNIRGARTTRSDVVGELYPGDKVKVGFLRDDWYAVFNTSEPIRDEAEAIGYVFVPLLKPVAGTSAGGKWGEIRYVDKNEIRIAAVEALGKIKDPKAVKPLINVLVDKEIRLATIWALGSIGDKTAIPALTKLLDDQDKYVRYNAAKALNKIGSGK